MGPAVAGRLTGRTGWSRRRISPLPFFVGASVIGALREVRLHVLADQRSRSSLPEHCPRPVLKQHPSGLGLPCVKRHATPPSPDTTGGRKSTPANFTSQKMSAPIGEPSGEQTFIVSGEEHGAGLLETAVLVVFARHDVWRLRFVTLRVPRFLSNLRDSME
jgi:hypothetical protein